MPTTSEIVTEDHELRACVRDLVAVSAMPAWWIGRSPAEIAASVRDLLVRMLRVEAAFVQVNDPATGQPLISATGPGIAEMGATLSVVSVQVGLAGELGMFAAGSSRDGFPRETESLLLQVLGNQVAAALRHAALLVRRQRAEAMLSARAAERAAVARVGLVALSGAPVAEVLEQAVQIIGDALHAEFCQVLELAADGQSLLLRAGSGWQPGLVGHARVSAGRESQGGYTLSVAEPVIVSDLGTETRFTAGPLLRQHGVVSGITVIIHDHGRPFGVLGAHMRDVREFTQDDVNILQSIANLLAIALHRNRTEAEREELLRRAQRAAAARDRAVGIVSHDLGNPLSTIQICAAALLDREPPPLGGIRHMARIVQRSADWMQRIVQDLLDRTSLDAGRLALERHPTEVSDVIGAAEVMFAPVAEEQEVEFVVESGADLPRVDADPDRLLQVLSNLLGNAVKFTPAGGRVVLAASRTDYGSNAAVRFTVSDTGPGIAPEDLAHVFEWFWHSGSEPRIGTGLGLAIARGLIEAHRSRLEVESTPGRGSTFWFTMPGVGGEA